MDYASRIASKIKETHNPTQTRIEAIIVLHTKPMVNLLKEIMNQDHEFPCPRRDEEDMDAICNCGIDYWSERIRKVLDEQ